MAKTLKKKKATRNRGPILSLTRTNYIIFGVAVIVIAIGYYFLSIGPANSIQSLTIAPIILIIGYVVIVPLAIFWRKRKDGAAAE